MPARFFYVRIFRSCRTYVVLLSVVLASIGTIGQTADAPPYSVLLQHSLSNAPTLLEQAAQVRAASADAKQAHAWLNPSVDTIIENLGAPLSGGMSQRQNTYSITQPFEITSKRNARIQAGERDFAVAEARDRQTQIIFSAQLAIAYATAEAMQNRKMLATEDVKRATDDLYAARALVKAGKEAKLRIAQAQASVSAAQAAEQAAVANMIEALENLSALAGVKEPYSSVNVSLMGSAEYRPLDPANVDETPAVITAIAERDAFAAKVNVEEKKSLPDISLSAGMRRFGWTSETAFVIGISAPLPIFDQNSSAIAAAKERAAAADARQMAARLNAMAARRTAFAQVTASEKRLEAATQGEQAATEAYQLGRIGYEGGKTSLVELLLMRRALSDAKLLTIEARLERIRALAALSQADGVIAFGGKQ